MTKLKVSHLEDGSFLTRVDRLTRDKIIDLARSAVRTNVEVELNQFEHRLPSVGPFIDSLKYKDEITALKVEIERLKKDNEHLREQQT